MRNYVSNEVITSSVNTHSHSCNATLLGFCNTALYERPSAQSQEDNSCILPPSFKSCEIYLNETVLRMLSSIVKVWYLVIQSPSYDVLHRMLYNSFLTFHYFGPNFQYPKYVNDYQQLKRVKREIQYLVQLYINAYFIME